MNTPITVRQLIAALLDMPMDHYVRVETIEGIKVGNAKLVFTMRPEQDDI